VVRGTWSAPALRVLEERYLLRRDGRPVETPEEMCWRVARAVAEAERLHGGDPEGAARSFYELMVSRKFLPNSPTLMNAGKGNGQQLSACFVLPVEDSMEGIFDALKYAAIIHKSGGGTGFSFSRLRPEGSEVSTTQGVASGPVSFMKVFDAATESVKQGGARRGANMGILRVDHPDILKFIECKLDGGITNFNISVAATDAFMKALAEDGEYELIAPHTGRVVGRLRAREVFGRICRAAWASGDPGMIFIDRINRSPANPTPELGLIEATNPCGEQPLLPFEACNLGSVNLSLMVTEDWGGIDWGELERVVRKAVRFLDDVIDVNPYPLPQIHEMVKGNRRIGLGVMGWADLLFKLGIPYDSEGALDLAEEVMAFINRVGHDESARLAEERGPFPNWSRSIYREGRPLRNATVTTIAPTGTISIIADCSSGIEPVFALAYTHRANGRELEFVNPVFLEAARRKGFEGPELMSALARQGTLKGLEVPEEVRRVFVTAMEIDPEWHVRMQAAFQRHTDNAVSKTINMPNSATVEDVERAYLLAYELGCLGITVFRDGCKGAQVLNAGTAPKAEARKVAAAIKPRPEVVAGYTRQVKAPEGTVNITLNSDQDGLLEVFINVGKAGSDIAALAEALGRLISLALRLPSPMSQDERAREVASQLKNIGGSRFVGFGPNRVRSLPDAVAGALEKHLGLSENGGNGKTGPQLSGNLCPGCGNNSLVYEEGCRKCPVCGYSEC
jgi:ribonucleoside-diphosphate reductase alpha chain